MNIEDFSDIFISILGHHFQIIVSNLKKVKGDNTDITFTVVFYDIIKT
jgi:hypothetical protein